MTIRVYCSTNQDSWTLAPYGYFDIDTSNQCLKIVRELPDPVSQLVIDMAGVTEIDASFLSTLLILHQEQSMCGGIRIINCSKQIARVLSISGADRLMPVGVSGKYVMDADSSSYFLRSSDAR